MAGKGFLIAGVVFLVIGSILVGLMGWGIATYLDGLSVQKSNEDLRDMYEPGSASYESAQDMIDENEELLSGKMRALTICTPLALIFFILGVVFLVKHNKTRYERPPQPPPEWN